MRSGLLLVLSGSRRRCPSRRLQPDRDVSGRSLKGRLCPKFRKVSLSLRFPLVPNGPTCVTSSSAANRWPAALSLAGAWLGHVTRPEVSLPRSKSGQILPANVNAWMLGPGPHSVARVKGPSGMSVPEFFLAPYVIHVFENLYPVHSFIMMIILRERQRGGGQGKREGKRAKSQAGSVPSAGLKPTSHETMT